MRICYILMSFYKSKRGGLQLEGLWLQLQTVSRMRICYILMSFYKSKRGGLLLKMHSPHADSTEFQWNRPYSSGIRSSLEYCCLPQHNKHTVDSGFHSNPLMILYRCAEGKKESNTKHSKHSRFLVSIDPSPEHDIPIISLFGTTQQLAVH
jgi:hypothetical protein